MKGNKERIMNNLYFNSEAMKLLICGILTPFIVYSIMYIAHVYGVTGYFHGHDDDRSVKLMAVWVPSSIQVLLSVFFVNKKEYSLELRGVALM